MSLFVEPVRRAVEHTVHSDSHAYSAPSPSCALSSIYFNFKREAFSSIL